MKVVVYPGSFDPPTNGHLDIIKRASKLTQKLIVAVLNNQAKNPMFTADEKMEILKELTKNMENVEVLQFDGLLVDFCERVGSNIVIRGLRAVTDFEYEFQIALTNKTLNKNVETLFMTTTTENLWLSSSVVKEIAILNGEYSAMVPEFVKTKIEQKILEKRGN